MMAAMDNERRAGYQYVPCYCEENIYRLAEDRRAAAEDGTVILVSNRSRTVAIGAQRTAVGSRFVVWDYHVIYLEAGLVFDLDAVLAIPTPAAEYVAAAFPPALYGPGSPYVPWFSAVPARRYLDAFSSNRDHMRDEEGRYRQPPPPWPPIYRPEHGNTLFDLVDGKHPAVSSYSIRFPAPPQTAARSV